MANNPYPGTQAVQRALRLLRTFTDERPELGLSELSRLARLNKATTYRLISALQAEGLVAQNRETEKYRLGPEAIALGGRALRQHSLHSLAVPELQRLAADTGETATLEVLADGEMMILEEMQGQHVLGPSHLVGTRWPAHATSTGKAILAALPEAERDRILSARLKSFTARTIVQPEAWAKELERIARQGYATAIEELEVGFVAVGAAVLDRLGQPAGAISLGGPRQRFDASRLAELGPRVREAATRLSAASGWPGRSR